MGCINESAVELAPLLFLLSLSRDSQLLDEIVDAIEEMRAARRARVEQASEAEV